MHTFVLDWDNLIFKNFTIYKKYFFSNNKAYNLISFGLSFNHLIILF